MDGIHPLRAYRQRQNPPLTQDQLAELLGVSKSAISRWEARRRKMDQDNVSKISEATGIAPAELRPDLAELLRN